jgi:hypothetical protein
VPTANNSSSPKFAPLRSTNFGRVEPPVVVNKLTLISHCSIRAKGIKITKFDKKIQENRR